MFDPKAAHRHSSNHRAELLASSRCGCFYCLHTFRVRISAIVDADFSVIADGVSA